MGYYIHHTTEPLYIAKPEARIARLDGWTGRTKYAVRFATAADAQRYIDAYLIEDVEVKYVAEGITRPVRKIAGKTFALVDYESAEARDEAIREWQAKLAIKKYYARKEGKV